MTGALAFPPSPLGLLVFLAPVPLLLVLESLSGARPGHSTRRLLSDALGAGVLWGFAFFLALLHWIVSLPMENVTVPFLMYPALVLLSLYLSLFPGIFALLYALGRARGRLPGILLAPFLFTAVEYARAHGELGFPWGTPGYALWKYLPLVQVAEFTGVFGATFLVVLVAALFAAAARSGRVRAVAALAGALGAVVLLWVVGGRLLDRLPPAERLRIACLQPNVGEDVKWDPAHREEIVENLLAQTIAARNALPALVIWPETAAPARVLRDPRVFEMVRNAVNAAGIPVLAGFPDAEVLSGEVRHYNAAALFRPGEGVVERYAKVRLVPFSERFPFQDVAPWINGFDFGQANFHPGPRETPFRRGPAPFGLQICFESIFPDAPRRLVNEGARFLVNITNDEWFGPGVAPYQHATMNVFRAVENRVGIARAANTGISMFVERSGRIVQPTGLFVKTTLVGEVELAGPARTFYGRHGDWIAWASLLVALAAVALSVLRKRS